MIEKISHSDSVKKIISFDLDGTLVSAGFGDMVWNHGIPEAYAEKHSIPFDDARILVMKEYASVGDSNILWYKIEHWLNRFDLQITGVELLKKYETYIEPLPNAIDVVKKLKDSYTLIIASNAARIFVEKELEYTGLDKYFSHKISATTDYNMVKKDRAFYEKICTIFNVLPEEIVHVGDHEIFDFQVPSDIGIQAYHIRDRKVATEDQRSEKDNEKIIYDLADLLDKL